MIRQSKHNVSGAVNPHNCVYYATEDPHINIKKQLNDPGVTALAGFSCKGVVGPITEHTNMGDSIGWAFL